MLSLIVAASENNVIGRNGEIPWMQRSDLKRFKTLTWGHPMIMGRKTFESILKFSGEPLKGRSHVILTRDKSWVYPHQEVEVFQDPERALGFAQGLDREPFIIGGSQIYEIYLSRVERVHLTRIHTEVEGDAFFPRLGGEWIQTGYESHEPRPEWDQHSYSFITLERDS